MKSRRGRKATVIYHGAVMMCYGELLFFFCLLTNASLLKMASHAIPIDNTEPIKCGMIRAIAARALKLVGFMLGFIYVRLLSIRNETLMRTLFFSLIPLTMMEISIKLTWWNVQANRVRQLQPRFVQIFINEFKCFQQIGKHSKNLKFSDTFVRARNWFQSLEGANRDDGEERKFLQFERAINTMWKLTNVVTVNQP